MSETTLPLERRAATRVFAGAIAGTTWLSIVAHVFLSMPADTGLVLGILAGVLRSLIFFTILTNLLVALVTTAWALDRRGPLTRPSAATAIASYILLVSIIYTLLLRGQWNPNGPQKIVEIVLHDLVPLAYVGFWLFCVPRGNLRWREALPWLVYPVAFAIFNLLYALWIPNPYPFLDLGAFAPTIVLRNIIALAVVFLVVGLLFILVDRALKRPRTSRA